MTTIPRVWTLLLVLALLSCSSDGGDQAATEDRSKRKVQNFWSTLRLANNARLDGNTDAAITAYRKALSLDPDHEEALFYLGVSLEQSGRYGEAISTYEKLIEMNPNSGRALSQLAELLLTPKPGSPLDFARAESILHRLIQVNREQAGPFLLLGRLALNRGDWTSAATNFLLAADFGAQEGFAWAGYTAYIRGDRHAAEEHLQRPLEMQQREREMAGAGVRAEGDVLPAPDRPLGALDRAALVSSSLLGILRGGTGAQSLRFRPLGAGVSSKGKGVWGDYNGDGKPDLAVGGRRLTLYRNEAGSFRDVTGEAGLGGLEDVVEVTWADYDSDGRPDLYVGAGNGVQLFRNRDGVGFEAAVGAGLDGTRKVLRALFLDLDADGDPDLLETGAGGEDFSPARLYRNTAGVFSPATAPPVSADETVVDAAAADFDGDGRTDLVMTSWKRAVRIFLQKDGVTWQMAHSANTGRDVFSVVPLDYDRDGATDLFVASHAPWEDALRSQHQPAFRPAGSMPLLLRNTGGGNFADVTGSAGLTSAYGVMQALAADFDGDGWVDLVLANGSLDAGRLESSVVLRNEAGQRFALWSRIPADNEPSNITSASITDFDGDGAPDIFLGSNPHLPRSVTAGGVFRNTSHP